MCLIRQTRLRPRCQKKCPLLLPSSNSSSALLWVIPECNMLCEMPRVPQAPVVTLPQLDFASSMALLLGVPIPFGNVGRLSRELWLLSGAHDAPASFRAALAGNAWQARCLCNIFASGLDERTVAGDHGH